MASMNFKGSYLLLGDLCALSCNHLFLTVSGYVWSIVLNPRSTAGIIKEGDR
jgi:hypothetical protein